MTAETELCGWGRHPRVRGREQLSEDLPAITAGAQLSRGLARSYGDASLPTPGGTVAGSRLADRLISFDAERGFLRAEAGLSLAELSRLFLPRGWASPVMPGTQLVTLGGMVAADVHGKNHHVAGTFGGHVRGLRLRLADGDVVDSTPHSAADLFHATVGGMGLTGHILEVEVALERIPSPWVWAEAERIPDLDAFLAALRAAADDWPFTVGWIDTLKAGSGSGRGVLLRGRWATAEEAAAGMPTAKQRPTVPFDFPDWVLAPWSMRLFNVAYYRLPRGRGRPMPPVSFFHPLDGIGHWNRIYGRRGMTQYQCMIPTAAGADAVRDFLDLFRRLGGVSFLSVLKDCGPQGNGLLSFPCRGTTLNLDLPVRDDTQDLVDRLNEALIDLGGRVYLAKDAFTRREHFRAMEPRLEAFEEIRERYDPGRRLRSALSARLFGDES